MSLQSSQTRSGMHLRLDEQGERPAAQAEPGEGLERGGDDQHAEHDLGGTEGVEPEGEHGGGHVKAAPIPWAKRFGGPATTFSSKGAPG